MFGNLLKTRQELNYSKTLPLNDNVNLHCISCVYQTLTYTQSMSQKPQFVSSKLQYILALVYKSILFANEWITTTNQFPIGIFIHSIDLSIKKNAICNLRQKSMKKNSYFSSQLLGIESPIILIVHCLHDCFHYHTTDDGYVLIAMNRIGFFYYYFFSIQFDSKLNSLSANMYDIHWRAWKLVNQLPK